MSSVGADRRLIAYFCTLLLSHAGLEAVAVLVHAVMEAHLIDPALHRIPEAEFAFFERLKTPGLPDMDIFEEVHKLLQKWRAEVAVPNLRLPAYMVMRDRIAGTRCRAGAAVGF